MEIGAALMAAFVALAVVGVTVAYWAIRAVRRSRHQRRLARGFDRARRVRQSGSGEQGRPYSVYTEETWRD